MAEKTPEELEAEMWERIEKKGAEAREARRERIRQARLTSDKEPFDFERLRALYEPIAVPPRPTIPPSMADQLEESYYLSWSNVKTLQQAAEYIAWLNLHEAG